MKEIISSEKLVTIRGQALRYDGVLLSALRISILVDWNEEVKDEIADTVNKGIIATAALARDQYAKIYVIQDVATHSDDIREWARDLTNAIREAGHWRNTCVVKFNVGFADIISAELHITIDLEN